MEYVLFLAVLIFVLLLFSRMEFRPLHASDKGRTVRLRWSCCVGFMIAVVLNGVSFGGLTPLSALLFGVSGAVCGEVFFLVTEALRQGRDSNVPSFYDDGLHPRFYITGDKHRDFRSVERFCREQGTRKKDVLIVLGDAGFNYFGDGRDEDLKRRISALNITLFCIHGNKEKRPSGIESYGKRDFCGGKVYYEPQYPNLLFAADGEFYRFGDKQYFVMGGAHSVDKNRCLKKGLPYWEDELPTPALMKYAEERLAEKGNEVYGILTHTCPFRYLPTETFVSVRRKKEKTKRGVLSFRLRRNQPFEPDIDRTAEYWLGDLEQKLSYRRWFCGHYHVDKEIDRVTMLYREIRPLQGIEEGE